MKLKNQKIQFIQQNPNLLIYEKFYPQPSSSFVPEWYKQMDSYIDKIKQPLENSTSATIKRCMPVFDAITMGYIIPTHLDINVITQEGIVQHEDGKPEEKINIKGFTSIMDNPISFHNFQQANKYPNLVEHVPIAKFENPWIIKTPPGYSTLFLSPIHQNLPFKILEGVVDTDIYTEAVNFPFILTDPAFEGIIPAGTPLAQIIIFKRDNWKMEFGNEQDLKKIKSKGTPILRMFFDAYKTHIRQPKTYK